MYEGYQHYVIAVKSNASMPPFRLEGVGHRPPYSRKPKIIYTKNAYSEGVKIKGWQELKEHCPIDVDPYCQGKINYFLSHYHRLGTQKNDTDFRTTTGDMLQQVFIEDKTVEHKLMDNYYTLINKLECFENNRREICPLVCADNYSTTMQDSYLVPKPYIMHRLAFAKIPYMQNQKYLLENPDLSPHKFYDDNFPEITCQFQKFKNFRWTSYSPMTGSYTNGENPKENVRQVRKKLIQNNR